jgi:hypothetical protein
MSVPYREALAGHPGLKWAYKLDGFFRSRAGDILFITKHLSGQREIWLHGEILLDLGRVEGEDKSLFAMNEVSLYPGAKVDLHIPGALIAEIKLVSSKHKKDALLNRPCWGLHEDFRRLHKSTVRGDPHLFILVLVDEGEPYQSDEFGDRVRTFEPEPAIPTQELDGFGPQDGGAVTIRAWMVTRDGEERGGGLNDPSSREGPLS